MSKKKYWQSFGELNQTENFQESANKEFKEELLPLEDLDDKGILDAKTPRRDFLKTFRLIQFTKTLPVLFLTHIFYPNP